MFEGLQSIYGVEQRLPYKYSKEINVPNNPESQGLQNLVARYLTCSHPYSAVNCPH